MSNLITKLNYSKLKQVKCLVLNKSLRSFASVSAEKGDENETHFGFETVKESEKAAKGKFSFHYFD